MTTPIYIAHISDLHFGAKNQTKCWSSLLADLRRIQGLELVLVTGDVVHTPRGRYLDEAKQALDTLLPVPYFVCPGNHDRHFFGNVVGNWLARLIVNDRFYNVFQNERPTLKLPVARTLGPPDNQWNVVVSTVDTSEKADFFARGAVRHEDLEALNELPKAHHDADLNVLLVHHHLMAIPELEIARKGKLHEVADVTGMVNSGQLLSRLAEGPVDLVLHGHQHARHFARYGGGYAGGDVAVIAAGSGTGNSSVSGCNLEHATYNILKLGPDRSIEVLTRQYDKEASKWVAALRNSVGIVYTSTSLRRSQFRRKSGGQEAPDRFISRRRFATTYRADGDIESDNLFENWRIENGKWSIRIHNTSGRITHPHITVDDNSEHPTEVHAEFAGENQWRLQCKWDNEQTRTFGALSVAYVLLRGGLVTAEQLADFVRNSRSPGWLRQQGYEYTACRVPNHLRSADVLVELPPRLVPSGRPRVVSRLMDQQDPAWVFDAPDLVPYLDVVQPGRYLLSVPFPRPGFAYGIAWRPPPEPAPSPLAQRFWDRAHGEGADLARFVAATVKGVGPRLCVQVFIPKGLKLERVGTHSTSSDRFPDDAPVLDAWAGILKPDVRKVAVNLQSPDDPMVEWIIPIGLLAHDDRPWGMLRIMAIVEKNLLEQLTRDPAPVKSSVDIAVLEMVLRAVRN
jgi:predicted MPP superfamily phosphohydrolase